MSRIGRKPIPVPEGVTVNLKENLATVTGPKGELSRQLPREMGIVIDDGTITVTRPSDIGRHRALHGLTRTLLSNMIEGVTSGFSKSLEIRGVGYKAEPTAKGARLVVGYSHVVEYEMPAGIKISVQGAIGKVEGIDKEKVGQVAADIRKVRPPEPYKGKGIRYVGEKVRTKAGKTGAKA